MGSTSSTPSPSPSPSPSPTPSTDPIISPHPPHIHQFLKHSLINHSHLFTTLPQLSLSEIDRALDMTIARARRHEYLPGTEVQTGTLHGDTPPTPSTPSHIYLVERGHLSIQMYKNGNWMHIHDASRGDVINDLAVYYQQPKPRALVVVDGNDDTPAQTPLDDTTPTPAVIWSIPAPAFTSFIQSSPYISQTLQSRTWLRSHLTHHELFTDVDDERMRETLVARFRKEKIPKGTHIVEVGDIGERFYLIEEGTCEVLAPSVPSPPLRNTSSSTSSTSSDPSSQLVAVGTRGPGETFGEIALLYNVRRNATIKALTDCTIWSVDSTTFLNSCHQGSVYLKNIFWEHASVIDPKTGERLMNATDFFDAMRLATSDREQQRALRSQRRREEKLAKGEKWTEKDEEMENKRIKKEKERKHELMSEAQLKLLFQLADQSGDNLIAFGEFVILHSLLSKPHTHNRFKIAFRLFDRNKDGFISRDEFINCMRSLAKDRGQQINLESDPFVRQLFPTPTSVLTYDQFEALLLKDDLPTYLTHLRHDLREINAYLFRLNTMMTLDELATPATDAGGSFAHNPKLHWKNLVAGGIAGAVSRTLVSPMERLKLLFQMQGRPPKYTSIVQALRVIWIEDGIRGFFRGNLSNVVRITPASALQFFFYDVYKTWMFGDQTTLSPWQRLLAGGNAGATACIITYPLDFIRARLTLQSGPNPPYRGIMHGITTVIKVEGVRGLYKGMWPSIVGVYPYIGIDFAVYETLKLHVVKNFSSLEKDHNRIMLLACGAIAGVTGQTVAYPLDLVRRRLQVQGFEQAKYTYKGGIINTMQTIVKEEGLKGLYKGMVPNLMKVVPAVSTSFVVYEHMRQYLDRAT